MLLDLLKIDLSLGLLLFIPGYLILIALLKTGNPLGILGNLVVSFALSLGITNFSLMLIDKLRFRLNPINIISALAIVSFTGLAFYLKAKKRKALPNRENQRWTLFFLIMSTAIFIRIIYLVPKIIPHTTDLGHHMYWANFIVKFQELPNYGIPDVIIGEHIIFGAISILSGIGVISALPVAVLFIINCFSLLAVFLLTKELASTLFKKKSANKIGLLSLIAIGIFYAIASPQASYINGGVIGNLLGNFFIPTIFYLFIKALREREPTIAGIGFFLIGTLIFTHHLSTFIFFYSLAGFLLFMSLSILIAKFFFKEPDLKINSFLKTFFNLKTSLVSLFLLIFIFVVRVPSYLNLEAIETAVGSPSKETRVGLTLNNIIHSTGSWRVFYSIIGIIFLALVFRQIFKKKSLTKKIYLIKITDPMTSLASISLALSWFITIFIMSHWPALLKIDIISGRIGNYLTYPSAVLAAFGVYSILQIVLRKNRGLMTFTVFMIIFIPGIISGLFDISESYEEDSSSIEKTIETFRGSKYLADKTSANQKILKDHIHLTADTWIKNFLMRDYREPLSRTLLKRYSDPVKERETCTRDMIAIPETKIGRNCFQETGVEFLILKDGYDTHQFEISENFSRIFTTNEVVIFQRNIHQ